MRLLQGQLYQQILERKTMIYPYNVSGIRHVDH